MTLFDRFLQARAVLELGPDDDLRSLKGAYRRKVSQFPPDQAPEAFRELREAYELLLDPTPVIDAWLESPNPEAPLPAAPEVVPLPKAATAKRLLDLLTAQLSLDLPEDS